uniref:Metallo-beta-lactamase domain-containing protein n=1 Tax=Ditylenchus dipsaci TaxID=166011 RepID=A0A915D2I7_9BILA
MEFIRMEFWTGRLRYLLYVKTRVGPWYTKKQWEKAAIQHPSGHSNELNFEYPGITVFALPVGFDNYCYAIVNELNADHITAERQCILIDVGDATKMLEFLRKNKLILSAVLSTHKHWDHTLGNSTLKSSFPGLKFMEVGELHLSINGDVIKAGGLSLSVCSTPGHTRKHFIFLLKLPDEQRQLIFTGDFLFNAGSGRLYECSPDVQLASIAKFVGLVKPTDLIFPGHEYALENYKFSHWLWKRSIRSELLPSCPNDRTYLVAEYGRKVDKCQLARSALIPLVPFSVAEQLQYNLFLNTADESIQALAGVVKSDGEVQRQAQTFFNLFKLKDEFWPEKNKNWF